MTTAFVGMTDPFIAMALVAEAGARLAEKGHTLRTFVSPNVEGVEKDHNFRVFDDFTRKLFERGPDARP